jgi:hypothetical protein
MAASIPPAALSASTFATNTTFPRRSETEAASALSMSVGVTQSRQLPNLTKFSANDGSGQSLALRTYKSYFLINPADGSTLCPADPFVITRIQIACVDENGPVVVMSGVLRFEIFRMTRSITHVIKFSMKQTSGWASRNPAHSIWRGRVARVAAEG